ncbi:phosphate acyltransferase [Desulfocurvus sp.]|uniref:phosphate acyltransferase n=1 Tax=Desulfocurvus sp. TaxID=2871698 RepID=UPI0025C548BE|nr:phosphate acyltransferase [Desulfocurvus sp.]MCK9239303.1 phosphate acyltransferase [Desulfocurvus sp.]
MLQSFSELLQKAAAGPAYRVCIAAAEDAAILAAAKMAQERGIIDPVLVGDADRLRALCAGVGLEGCRVLPCQTPAECAAVAVEAVRRGEADVLMKGTINTSDYLRAILNRERGLRGGSLLSALAVYEVREYHKLIFCSDSGMNTAPGLEQKVGILNNALAAMRRLGFAKPKVAALTANEMVDPKVPATVDTQALARMAAAGETLPCVLEGPIAFDVAFDRAAAEHKHIASEISGDVDLILAPNIETGNALGKSWLTLNKAQWAGVILGTTHPVVLGSRSDTAQVKINSIALACLLAREGERGPAA